MAVTVRSVLESGVIGNARIISGKSDLDRIIGKVSFIDSPIDMMLLNSDQKFLMPGDFFITTFFAVKDDPEMMLQTVRMFSSTNSSGLCIVDQYLSELPQRILDFADEYSYPILFVDKDIPYGNIIRDIMVMIIQDKEDTIFELKIDGILKKDVTASEVENAVLSINGSFQKNILVINCRVPDMDTNKLNYLKSTINSVKEWSCLKYKDNILIFISFSKNSKEDMSAKIRYIIEQIKRISSKYVIGISNPHYLSQTDRCIEEALISCESHETTAYDIIYYKELGAYKLLIPQKNNKELKDFHDEIIRPIMEYDLNYKKNLLETAVCFIDNDGDFSKTAEKMFLHENSVRYRIKKIMEILNMSDKNLIFLEQLSIAIKINKILKEKKSDLL